VNTEEKEAEGWGGKREKTQGGGWPRAFVERTGEVITLGDLWEWSVGRTEVKER